jgi:prophage maintenance system killer protein
MEYLDLQTCVEEVFPFIHALLTKKEPAPVYAREQNGMQELEKVLTFVRDDCFYPSFTDKAAYMICSIAGSQYFSNGNKRLSVTVLLSFLSRNGASIEVIAEDGYAKIFTEVFSSDAWERNTAITDPHALFLYNLAITIGDRKQWGCPDFTTLREKVAALFAHIYQR